MQNQDILEQQTEKGSLLSLSPQTHIDEEEELETIHEIKRPCLDDTAARDDDGDDGKAFEEEKDVVARSFLIQDLLQASIKKCEFRRCYCL